jgi:peroxiredoxin
MTRLTIGDPAPNVSLLNSDGAPQTLEQLRAGGVLLVSFIRQFG